MSAGSSWWRGQSSKARVAGLTYGEEATGPLWARGPGHDPGKATRWSVAKVPAPTPCLGGISSRLSARPQTEFWPWASVQSGSPGEGDNFSPLVGPHGLLAGARGRTRAGSAGDGFAERGQLVSLLLDDQGAERERGSPLHVAPAPPPPGPGLFRPGLTKAKEWKRRRPPNAAGDGSREMRVAFKVSRNPSAAGGG